MRELVANLFKERNHQYPMSWGIHSIDTMLLKYVSVQWSSINSMCYLQNLVQLLPILDHDHIGLAVLSNVMTRLWAVGSIDPSRQGTVWRGRVLE